MEKKMKNGGKNADLSLLSSEVDPAGPGWACPCREGGAGFGLVTGNKIGSVCENWLVKTSKSWTLFFFFCGRLSAERGFHQSPSRPRECTTQGWLCGVPAWAQHTGTWPNKDGGESGLRRRLLPVLVCEGVKQEEEEEDVVLGNQYERTNTIRRKAKKRPETSGMEPQGQSFWFSYESATNKEQRSNCLLSLG